MAELIVAHELQDFLVAQGIAQLPATAPSPAVPVVYADPRDGAAQPRRTAAEGWAEKAAITLRETLEQPPDPLEEFLERQIVDVIVLAIDGPTAKLTQRAVRRALAGRRLWTMGTLLVEQVDIWRGDQALPRDPDRFDGYSRVQSFSFLCRTKALAGLPYTP